VPKPRLIEGPPAQAQSLSTSESGSGERVSEGAPKEKPPMEPDEVPLHTSSAQASNGYTAHPPLKPLKAKVSKAQAKKTAYILQMLAAIPQSLSDADAARFAQRRYEDVTAEDIHRVRLEHEQGNLGATVQ